MMGIMSFRRAQFAVRWITGGLAARLLVVCLGLYIFVAALVTLVEAALVSQQSRSEVDAQIDTLAATFAPPIAQALWNFDESQLDILLNVLAKVPTVGRIRLRTTEGGSYEISGTARGAIAGENEVATHFPLGPPRVFPITHANMRGTDTLGRLTIEPSLLAARRLVESTVGMGVVHTLVVVVLLSMVLIFAVARLVGRPLQNLAGQIAGIDPEAPGREDLVLEHYAGAELALVADSFNALLAKLRRTIFVILEREREVLSLNASLRSEVAAGIAELKELEESQARNKAFIAALPDLFFTLDREGRFLEYSVSATEQLFVSPEVFIGKLISEIGMGTELAERSLDCIRTALEQNRLVIMVYDLPLPTGPRRFEGRFVPLDADRVILVARDITEAGRREELLRASLAEKEVLLREVHHRVKNNLQIISSIISLQESSCRDEAVRAMYQDTQMRIRSIASLHELLYGSQDLSSIDIAEYLASVVRELSTGYYRDKVSIRVEARSDILSIDEAMPVGLIATELLTNALKYAYPPDTVGEIRVSYSRSQTERRLEVHDEGLGLPPGVDPAKSDSLGFTLVRTLAEQIGGRLSIGAANPGGPSPGLDVLFTFPARTSVTADASGEGREK